MEMHFAWASPNTNQLKYTGLASTFPEKVWASCSSTVRVLLAKLGPPVMIKAYYIEQTGSMTYLSMLAHHVLFGVRVLVGAPTTHFICTYTH